MRILTLKSTNRNAEKSQQELGMRKPNSFGQQTRNGFWEMAMVRLMEIAISSQKLRTAQMFGLSRNVQMCQRAENMWSRAMVRMSLDGKVQAILWMVYPLIIP